MNTQATRQRREPLSLEDEQHALLPSFHTLYFLAALNWAACEGGGCRASTGGHVRQQKE